MRTPVLIPILIIALLSGVAQSDMPFTMVPIDGGAAESGAVADVNKDGKPDLVSGKRFQARNVPAPDDDDPLGIYWYEFTRGANNAVTWTRHTVDYGSKAGSGLQMAVRDMDGDGDMDVVSAGKSGLFLAENLTRRPSPGRR